MYHIPSRFTVTEDKLWFDKCLKSVVVQHLSEELANDMEDEPYYVDFMRESAEPTGDDDQDLETPVVYEMVSLQNGKLFITVFNMKYLLIDVLLRTGRYMNGVHLINVHTELFLKKYLSRAPAKTKSQKQFVLF